MLEIPNAKLMSEITSKLFEEFNIDSRLSRYESMAPELIDLATELGLTDKKIASRALFIADFVITSSEISDRSVDDTARREAIVNLFVKALKERTEDAEALMKTCYLAYSLATNLRRNDSFLSGRGIDDDTRVYILIMMFIVPYFAYTQEILGEGNLVYELDLLSAALHEELPGRKINQLSSFTSISDPIAFKQIWEQISSFVSHHSQEVNDTVVLPYIDQTKMIFVNPEGKDPQVSSWGAEKSTVESIENVKKLVDFLQNADQKNKLIYVRGKLFGTDKFINIIRNPIGDEDSLIIMQCPVEDVNVTEVGMILNAQSFFDEGWVNMTDVAAPITKTEQETVVTTEEKMVEEEIEEEVEVEDPGFFAKIKRIFFGGGKSKKKVKKSVQKPVEQEVRRLIEKTKKMGFQLPDFVAKSMTILSLSDLRLFETFDTIRESEYQLLGALESNFKNNVTSLFIKDGSQDPDALSNLLDGLDEVFEDVINHYFDGEFQILPTELLFLSKEDQRFIICLDGNDDRIVGTIAETYVKDMSDWQSREEPEKLQRRSLHMRTGQLLSTLNHTPFDRSVERIFKIARINSSELHSLEHAILPLESDD